MKQQKLNTVSEMIVIEAYGYIYDLLGIADL